jgi:membrane protein DedA with SNARE-associated domain
MDMASYVRHLIEFVREHEAWAAPVVGALAFGESLAFISLVLPAWGALVGIGALISASGIKVWPIWMAGALGAALGDWLSYWMGQHLEDTVAHLWPLSRHPALLFLGRFFGPLRASVPLAAGIFAMPYWRFQCANVSSACVWAAVLLTLGDTGSKLLHWWWR